LIRRNKRLGPARQLSDANAAVSSEVDGNVHVTNVAHALAKHLALLRENLAGCMAGGNRGLRQRRIALVSAAGEARLESVSLFFSSDAGQGLTRRAANLLHRTQAESELRALEGLAVRGSDNGLYSGRLRRSTRRAALDRRHDGERRAEEIG